MTEDTLNSILLAVFIGEALLSLVAYIRIVAIYREEQGWRSILWRTLVRIFGLAVLVGLMLVPVGVVALFDLPRLPFTGIGVSLAVMFLLSGVIVFWIQIERLRSRPAPMNDDTTEQ